MYFGLYTEINILIVGMSVSLDEHFLNLEDVGDFLANDEWSKTSPFQEPDLDTQDKDLDECVRQQVDLTHSILEGSTPISDSNFDEVKIARLIANVRLLKDEKKLLQLAVKVEKQLEEPTSNQESLLDILSNLESSDASDLQAKLIADIRSCWYNSAIECSSTAFRQLLSKTSWPKEDPPKGSVEFRNSAQSVLALTLPGSLELFHILSEGLVERLKFNFSKGRDTARADKPEWLFAYIFRLLDPRMHWFQTELRTLTDSPMDKLITVLLPTLTSICHEAYALDSHFVSELIQFCNDLESKYFCESSVTKRLIESIFKGSALEDYISSEQAAFSSSLDALLRTGSHKIDFDVDCSCAKPTFAALNLREMIQQAGDLLRLDPPLVSKNIQLKLFYAYIDFLESELISFEKPHSSLARAVSSKKETPQSSTMDIEIPGRIMGASSFMKSFLESWSCNAQVAFHAELVEVHKASLNDLRSRAASRIASMLTREAQKSLKPYLCIDWSRWTDNDRAVISDSTIRAAVDGLKPSLDFVSRLCPTHTSDRLRVMRPFAEALAEILWRLVIQANVFTEAAASRLESDLETLWMELNLPKTASFCRILDAASVLKSGASSKIFHLSSEEIEGLNNRRVRRAT